MLYFFDLQCMPSVAKLQPYRKIPCAHFRERFTIFTVLPVSMRFMPFMQGHICEDENIFCGHVLLYGKAILNNSDKKLFVIRLFINKNPQAENIGVFQRFLQMLVRQLYTFSVAKIDSKQNVYSHARFCNGTLVGLRLASRWNATGR